MDICLHCSKPLPRNASFCSFCGNAVTESVVSFRDGLLQNLKKNLKREQFCWLIMGLLHLVGALYLLARIIIVGTVGLEPAALSAEEEITLAAAMTYLIITFLTELTLCLVNLFLARSTAGYVRKMDTDPKNSVARCGKVRILLWGIFFNGIALVFQILSLMLVQNHQIFFDYLGEAHKNTPSRAPAFSEGEELQ